MTLRLLSEMPSLITLYLNELRNIHTQTDRKRFNDNLQRIGFLIGYEISKVLSFEPIAVKTPLGIKPSENLVEQPVIIGILRAGAPLLEGLRQGFDKADIGFIGAFRNHSNQEIDFDIAMDYLACPNLEGRIVILADPMLASGKSLVKAVQSLSKYGAWKELHIVSVVAAPEGIALLEEEIPAATLWLAALDEKLNDHSYIVPGLGDAGDLCFGEKV